MEEGKKKVFNWKRLFLICAIILLVLAMSPLFWRNLMLDKLSVESLLNDPNVAVDRNIEYADDKILISIKENYFERYDNREFVEASFKWSNVKSIEYKDEYYGAKVQYIVVHLKKTGYDEVKKGLSRFRTLKFVLTSEPYIKGFFPNV